MPRVLKDRCEWLPAVMDGLFRGCEISITFSGFSWRWSMNAPAYLKHGPRYDFGEAPNLKAAKVAALRAVAKATGTKYAGIG